MVDNLTYYIMDVLKQDTPCPRHHVGKNLKTRLPCSLHLILNSHSDSIINALSNKWTLTKKLSGYSDAHYFSVLMYIIVNRGEWL